MRAALITADDIVANITSYDPDANYTPDAGLTLLALDDDAFVEPGMTYDPATQTFAAAPVPVPTEVSPLQMRRALRATGLLAQVDGFAKAQGGDTLDAWEYATSFSRLDPLINTGATALGMTEAQIDDLFRLAATLA